MRKAKKRRERRVKNPSPPKKIYPPGPRLSAPMLSRRFNITPRTLDRWILDPRLDFPKPFYILQRRYWDEPQIEEFEERRRAARTDDHQQTVRLAQPAQAALQAARQGG